MCLPACLPACLCLFFRAQLYRQFVDGEEPETKMEDIVLNISSQGIVLATEKEDAVVAYHRMPTISFAAGGDFEVRACKQACCMTCMPARL